MTIESIAGELKTGKLPDCDPQDIAAAVRFIADSIPTGLCPTAGEIRKATGVLNEYRHFEHTRTIGGAWHDVKGCDPTVQKCLIQALIELGALEDAEALADEALKASTTSKDATFIKEVPEYHGHRGRIRKQRFVAGGDLNDLVSAIDEYLIQYAAKRSYYHGINVVALRMIEQRNGLPARPGDDVATIAEDVLDQAINAPPSPGYDHWPLATASEACLALEGMQRKQGWCDKAELWLYRFLVHGDATPFSIESYARQIREIWNGDALRGVTCADRLARIIERHVVRTQRRWSVDPDKVRRIQADPSALEKNFSGERSFTVGDLQQMLGLCPHIGCVIDSAGARLGTGFLMAGSTFGFQEPLVFVTNAHVISDEVDGSIRSGNARVTFEVESAAHGSPLAHPVKKILFTSNPGDVGVISKVPENLDATIVSLATLPKDAAPLPFTDTVPLPSPRTKAFVVGHPASGALQFSLNDSTLLDVCEYERLMHYRTPTEPGSSGSPVFNSKWQVVALHHAGSRGTRRLHGEGTYEANEGITIQAIRRKLGLVT